MPVPLIENVRAILEDFEIRFRLILENAWEEWLEMPKRGLLSARSRASVVFDLIKAGALAEFDGDLNIRAIPKGQTIHFLFRERVLVRFKKANSMGVGSNIETQAVIEFVDPQMNIPGLLPEVYRVEVCYHLDKLQTRINSLAVTARNRHRKIWSYELARPASAAVVPLPGPENMGPPPAEVRVRKPIEKPETKE
jgi:hypothetical protein